MNHLFASIRYLNVICVSFPFNMRYSSVLTVTCPEVDRSTTQVEHAPNLPTNKTGQNGYYLTRNAFMRNWQELHDTNEQRILLSVTCPLALSLYCGERSGSVVKCLTQDRRAICSSLTGVTLLSCKLPQNVLRRGCNGKIHWMNRGSLLRGRGESFFYILKE